METSGVVSYKSLRSQTVHAPRASGLCMNGLVFIFCLGRLIIPEVARSTKITIPAFSAARPAAGRMRRR
jgi:hypothetical protein